MTIQVVAGLIPQQQLCGPVAATLLFSFVHVRSPNNERASLHAPLSDTTHIHDICFAVLSNQLQIPLFIAKMKYFCCNSELWTVTRPGMVNPPPQHFHNNRIHLQ